MADAHDAVSQCTALETVGYRIGMKRPYRTSAAYVTLAIYICHAMYAMSAYCAPSAEVSEIMSVTTIRSGKVCSKSLRHIRVLISSDAAHNGNN